MITAKAPHRSPAAAFALYFLRLGFVGPVARELVSDKKRRWFCPQHVKRGGRHDPSRMHSASNIEIGHWLTAAISVVSLAVLFRWRISDSILIGATAVVGLIAYPLLQPEWVMMK